MLQYSRIAWKLKYRKNRGANTADYVLPFKFDYLITAGHGSLYTHIIYIEAKSVLYMLSHNINVLDERNVWKRKRNRKDEQNNQKTV